MIQCPELTRESHVSLLRSSVLTHHQCFGYRHAHIYKRSTVNYIISIHTAATTTHLPMSFRCRMSVPPLQAFKRCREPQTAQNPGNRNEDRRRHRSRLAPQLILSGSHQSLSALRRLPSSTPSLFLCPISTLLPQVGSRMLAALWNKWRAASSHSRRRRWHPSTVADPTHIRAHHPVHFTAASRRPDNRLVLLLDKPE